MKKELLRFKPIKIATLTSIFAGGDPVTTLVAVTQNDSCPGITCRTGETRSTPTDKCGLTDNDTGGGAGTGGTNNNTDPNHSITC